MKTKIVSLWESRRNRYLIIIAAAVIILTVVLLIVNQSTYTVLPPPDVIIDEPLEVPEPRSEPEREPEPESEPLPKSLADELAGYSHRIDGSTATIPLTEAIYDCFGQGEHTPVHNTTPFAYQNLIDGKADLIFVTYPSEEEFERAREAEIELELVPVTKDALVFLVNIDNPVESITKAQLKDIYSGKIKNWSEVGGLDEDIIPYQRTPNSGSQTLMLKLLMDGQSPVDPPKEYIKEQMGELVDAVSAFDNSRAAIGYSMFYYVNNMYGNNRFKLLAIDGVKPSRDSIMTCDYPMNDGYYAVIRNSETENSTARKLVDWLLEDEGQAVAVKAGYIPLGRIEDVSHEIELDPIYLGDYENSSGTGGTVWKGWAAREELEKNGVKKPLSAVFYQGFNYIDYINTNIANELQALDLYNTRYMNSDTFDVVLKRSFPGIPNDYPHYSFSEDESILHIEFPEDNPYFRKGQWFSIKLTRGISPYGEGFDVIVSYHSAGAIIPGVDLVMPSVKMPLSQTAAGGINTELQSWTNGFKSNAEMIKQIEWRSKEAYRIAKDWGWDDFLYLMEPEIGYWKNYISVSYSLDRDDGYIGSSGGPLLSSICIDMDTGERVSIIEKLPEKINYSKAYAIIIPYWQTAKGQKGGDNMLDGYIPAQGSKVNNAVIRNYSVSIYVMEPNGRVLEAIFWRGDFE